MNMRSAHINCGGLTRKPDIELWAIRDHSQRFESFLACQPGEPICYSPAKAGSVTDDRLLGARISKPLTAEWTVKINSLDALTVLETGEDGNATLRSLVTGHSVWNNKDEL